MDQPGHGEGHAAAQGHRAWAYSQHLHFSRGLRDTCGRSIPDSFVTMGDVTYFAAYDPEHGRELWRTDGTRAGTRLVKDVRPGRESGLAGGVADGLVAVGGHLYFVADDGRHGFRALAQ